MAESGHPLLRFCLIALMDITNYHKAYASTPRPLKAQPASMLRRE